MTPAKSAASAAAPVTMALASWAANFEAELAPRSVTERAKSLILDHIRATAVGSQTPWAAAVRDVAVRYGASGRSTTFFFGDRLDPCRAALVNGSLAHAADIDDTHVGAMLHPGATVLPAVFAVAEEIDASGADVISAMIVGYEAAIRIALAVQPSHFQRGFQATATCGVFGAAVAAGRLFNLDAQTLAGAMGIAGSSAAGLAQFYYSGSLVKRVHAGMAAQSGVLAALLARAAVTGPIDILEGEAGFCRAYADTSDRARIVANLGDEFKLAEITVKPHATSARIQAAVEIAMRLTRDNGINPDLVAAVQVGIPRVVLGRLTQPEPPDVTAAQMSIPFTVALALMLASQRGAEQPLRVQDYQSALRNEGVRRLARVTECVVDETVEAGSTEESVPARVTVLLNDGTSVSAFVDRPLGGPGRPLSPAESGQLFRRSVGGLASDESIRGIIAAVDVLEDSSAAGITEWFPRAAEPDSRNIATARSPRNLRRAGG